MINDIYKLYNKIVESYNTSDNSRVFYIGMGSKSVDLSKVSDDGTVDPDFWVKEVPDKKKPGVTHKNYNNLTQIKLSNSAYMTNTLQYAFQYAMHAQNDDEKNAGIIEVVELPEGKKFFDVEDVNDYMRLGLSPNLAKIFKNMETYWLNGNIENNKMKLRSPQYVNAAILLKNYFKNKGTFIEKLGKSAKTVDEIFKEIQSDYPATIKDIVEQTFTDIFGVDLWQRIHNKYTKRFNSRSQLMQSVMLDLLETNADKKAELLKIKTDGKDSSDFNKKELERAQKLEIKTNGEFNPGTLIDWNTQYNEDNPASGGIQSAGDVSNRVLIRKREDTTGIFARNERGDGDGIPRYVGKSGVTLMPAVLKNDVLVQNYQLLFDSSVEWKYVNDNDFTYISPFIELFQCLQTTLRTCKTQVKDQLENLWKDEDLLFVQKRLNDREQHVYIDTISWLFYYMLTYAKLPSGEDNPFIGIKTSEKVGYLAITNFLGQKRIADINEDDSDGSKQIAKMRKNNTAFGYKDEELRGDFLNTNDTTLVLCKSLEPGTFKIFAHRINEILPSEEDLKRLDQAGQRFYASKYFRQIIDHFKFKNFKSISEYVKYYRSILSKIPERLKIRIDRHNSLINLNSKTQDNIYKILSVTIDDNGQTCVNVWEESFKYDNISDRDYYFERQKKISNKRLIWYGTYKEYFSIKTKNFNKAESEDEAFKAYFSEEIKKAEEELRKQYNEKKAIEAAELEKDRQQRIALEKQRIEREKQKKEQAELARQKTAAAIQTAVQNQKNQQAQYGEWLAKMQSESRTFNKYGIILDASVQTDPANVYTRHFLKLYLTIIIPKGRIVRKIDIINLIKQNSANFKPFSITTDTMQIQNRGNVELTDISKVSFYPEMINGKFSNNFILNKFFIPVLKLKADYMEKTGSKNYYPYEIVKANLMNIAPFFQYLDDLKHFMLFRRDRFRYKI